MWNQKNPCYQCGDRSETCHSNCKRYSEFRVQQDAEDKRARTSSAAGGYFYAKSADGRARKRNRAAKGRLHIR